MFKQITTITTEINTV